MRTETKFFCEKCNSHYDNPREATDCESSHLDIVETEGIVYKKGRCYPKAIVVTFSDGIQGTYGL